VEVRGLIGFVALSTIMAFALLSIADEGQTVEASVLAATLTQDQSEPPDFLAAVSSTIPATASTTSTAAIQAAPTTTIALVAPLATASTAAPTTTQRPLSVGENALALVRYDWQGRFPEWEITFGSGRSGIRALTYPREQRIEVFIRASDTPQSLHRVIAHELGHLVDVELDSAEHRDRWIEQRGIDADVPWWPGESAPDFATGAGDFAEAFAVWETGVQSQSTVGGQPSASDLAVLAELVS